MVNHPPVHPLMRRGFESELSRLDAQRCVIGNHLHRGTTISQAAAGAQYPVVGLGNVEPDGTNGIEMYTIGFNSNRPSVREWNCGSDVTVVRVSQHFDGSQCFSSSLSNIISTGFVAIKFFDNRKWKYYIALPITVNRTRISNQNRSIQNHGQSHVSFWELSLKKRAPIRNIGKQDRILVHWRNPIRS